MTQRVAVAAKAAVGELAMWVEWASFIMLRLNRVGCGLGTGVGRGVGVGRLGRSVYVEVWRVVDGRVTWREGWDNEQVVLSLRGDSMRDWVVLQDANRLTSHGVGEHVSGDLLSTAFIVEWSWTEATVVSNLKTLSSETFCSENEKEARVTGCERAMSMKANKENQGFKLLEEDCLDDRPCAAVKKFVASVLDKKDLKDQDVAASFRNLMEYREAPPSPTMGSHSAMDRDGLGSPNTPASPPPMGAASSGHTERLPNELLDEICEDIGMKSGEMELDFVEFLMEQDMDPQAYMTPEAILNSGGSLPSGAGSSSGSSGGGSISAASSNISTPSNSSGSGCGFPPVPSSVGNTGSSTNGRQNVDHDWPHHMPSPVVTAAPGTTTALSSGSNSPATKRIHLSTSENSSPNKESTGQQTALVQPPGSTLLPQPSQSPRGTGQVFKMPQTPPTPRRSLSCPQGTPGSSVSSNGGSGSGSSSVANGQGLPSKSGRMSPRPFSSQSQFSKEASEATGHSQSNNSSCAGISNFLFKNSEAVPRTQCYSPKPVQFSSCDHARRSSEGTMQIAPCQQPPPGMQQYHSMHHQQHPHQHIPGKDSGFQKPEKLAPPNINVKNFLQLRWGMQGGPAHPHHSVGMGKSQYGYHMQTPHHHPGGTGRMDSPLDQGYFSNESAGNGTSSSAPSPALTTSSMSSMSSLSSMTSLSTMMPADPKASNQPSIGSRQKSVHFADLPDGSPPDAMSQGQSAAGMDIQGYGRFTSNQSPSECAFDMDSAQQKSMQSKILPRLNHHVMKPGVAPYTVPNAAGAPPASTVGNYDFSNRSCCALNQQNRTSPADMSGSGGSAGSMQPFDFANSGSDGKSGGGDGSMYYVDSNQNMMRMDSSPGMDYPTHTSAYGNCTGGYNLPMMQQRMPCASPGYTNQQGMPMQMNGGMGMNIPSPMNIQQQGMGPSPAHDGLGTMGPPPAHSFQPQSMSTPCMPRGPGQPTVRSGMQGPSYGQLSPGSYDYSMNDRQPNSMDVQMFTSQQQQQQHMSNMMPSQSSGLSSRVAWFWAWPDTATRHARHARFPASQLGQHPGQMKPTHPMAPHHHHHPHPPQQQPPPHHMQAMGWGSHHSSNHRSLPTHQSLPTQVLVLVIPTVLDARCRQPTGKVQLQRPSPPSRSSSKTLSWMSQTLPIVLTPSILCFVIW
ncbi:hypothetical protein C0Q70_02927 [Pomacea canaliculata]|uniref:Uncharacterized protein n=1 Tax=Pomacea canaliculata TaxID=400727 RepID=A0A2T7PRB5_POMCA|nr:hypothetical protein C0Q70_02927 [Pomacea canaliculata]